MEQVSESIYAKIWIEDGILHCEFADKLSLDLETAKKCVEQRIAFSKGISYPCIIDMRGLKSANKEARDYMEKEGARLVKAGALIVYSALTKMLGNMFLMINQPKVPVKIFSDEKAAKEWLQKFKD